jgi:hypothetical protein
MKPSGGDHALGSTLGGSRFGGVGTTMLVIFVVRFGTSAGRSRWRGSRAGQWMGSGGGS